jgi:exonuclease I
VTDDTHIPRFCFQLDPSSIQWIREAFGPKRVSFAVQKAIDEMKARHEIATNSYSSVAATPVIVQEIVSRLK